MLIPSDVSPTVATVDLTALAHNVLQLRRFLSPGCNVMAVVKANAYGHGAVKTAQALVQQGIGRLAVFSIEEGIVLRQTGITTSIVILGPVFSQHVEDLVAHRLTPVVSDPAILTMLGQCAARYAFPYPIHLKVDTGMGRLGLTHSELETILRKHVIPPSLCLEGVMSHLADSDGLEPGPTEQQVTLFDQALKVVREAGFSTPLIHLANSAGIVRFPSAHYSLVRPGIMLYGYHTLPSSVRPPDLRPILSLTTRIVQLKLIQPGQTVSYNRTFMARRPTRVAVLPIGYSSGVSRRLSNRGQVLIRGQRATIAGIVCMDMMMVDVTEIEDIAVGDEVVLIGEQGTERITAQDIADWSDTISYEVLCAISPKIPRCYRSSS
ncbi:MAG: alanine racemase [Nitrospira sp.]|nr:alanine racemase [Nitrospira sp.]